MSDDACDTQRPPQPFLTADLENLADQKRLAPHEWYAQALEELASQLTFRNDYFYLLLGAAQLLRTQRSAATAPTAQASAMERP